MADKISLSKKSWMIIGISLLIIVILSMNSVLREVEIHASVDLLCNKPNFLLNSGLLYSGGNTTIDNGSEDRGDDWWNQSVTNESIIININPDLDNETQRKVIAHEECHKRQLIENRYVGLTCKDNNSQLIRLERECKRYG